MEYTIEHQPEFSWLKIKIPAGQKLNVEASAMAAMDSNLHMRTRLKGGLGRFLTRESLFMNEFTAHGGAGEIAIAPGPSGDIGHFSLHRSAVYLSSASYVAHSDGVTYTSKMQGLLQGFFSGAGLFLIRMEGTGDVWFNSYGALVEVDVQDDYLIDNGHVVAFTEGLQYEVVKLGGYKSLLFSGEGLVVRFRGTGKVYMQTKKPHALIRWADRFRRVQASSN
jgi:uncharacterized protein (TIGR00266 family)